MISPGFVKSIAADVRKELFEGGPGSGNWGHKGRPGHRGGSAGGGGKGKGVSAHKILTGEHVKFGEGEKVRINYGEHKGKLATFQEYSPSGSFAIVKVGKERASYHVSDLLAVGAKAKGGSNISPHVVKPGVHASTFYDKSGGLKTSEYRKLTDAQKTAVMRHGVQKYKEGYVPKSQQGKLSAAGLAANKKVGALEGMRRAALNNAKQAKSGSKEERAALHVAVSLQQKAGALFNQLKASGQKVAGSAQTTGSRLTGAALTAIKTSERQPGARG